MRSFRFEGLWDGAQWHEPGWVQVDDQGAIVSLAPNGEGKVEKIPGYALPGFQNAHSHAFQYAMAGQAEYLPKGSAQDDFWSWREAMYALALTLTPPQVEAIAAMLYAEMVRHGYTAVAEFHYLHHDPEGNPYASPAEMGIRLARAADLAGIRLTLIPIYYQRGGFGKASTPQQRRFLSADPEAYLRLVEATAAGLAGFEGASVALGIHSLRAASGEHIKELFSPDDPRPQHIHISEQQREVDDCLAAHGARPIAWLAEEIGLHDHMHLVHATHADASELQQIVEAGAHVVLCPTTEGNLGDGFFPLRAYTELGGRWSIGTDSHVSLSPTEELRLLDYGQRLSLQKRAALCLKPGDDSGPLALHTAWQSGCAAMGSARPCFAPGTPFDAVIYDAGFPSLSRCPSERRLSAIVYATDTSAIFGTMVQAEWVVKRGTHRAHPQILKAWQRW